MFAKNIKLFITMSLFAFVLSSFLYASSAKNYFSAAALASNGDNVLNLTGTVKIGTTTLTATATELNTLNLASQTEVILATGSISNVKKVTNLATSTTATVTLAAPDASIIGQVKTIQMTADNGDVALALTNVQGQTSGTTATFNTVDDTLVLVAGKNKWNVIAEIGIALS